MDIRPSVSCLYAAEAATTMTKLASLETRFSAPGVLMAFHQQLHRREEISLPTLFDEEPIM